MSAVTGGVDEEQETIIVKCEPDQGDPAGDDDVEKCKYCLELCDPCSRPGIRCLGICSKKIHVECLKRGGVPSPMSGDIFFNLTCEECNSPASGETLTRDKLSWFGVLALTLYNLREKSSGISKRGYFHWKSDISTFVDRHWEHFFQKGIKRKKNWVGTISGTLSHFSGIFFKSGTSELGESGWWRLCNNDPPEILMERNLKIVLERKRQAACQPKIPIKQYSSPTPSESSISFGEDSNCATDRTQAPSMYSRAYVQPTEILSDFLLADDDIPADLEMSDTAEREEESLSIAEMIRDVQNQNDEDGYNGDETAPFSHTLNNLVPEWINNNNSMLNQSTSYNRVNVKHDEARECDEEEQYDEEEEEEEEDDDDDNGNSDNSESVKETASSLFTVRPRREWPWKRNPTNADKKPRMSHHEESYLLQSIEKSDIDSFEPAVRRIYRKLAVRKSKREYSLPVFDIDRFSANMENARKTNRFGNRVLDRFSCEMSLNGFFEQRLQGYHEPAAVHSPYTNRLLKPFIRRDATCRPLWLRLMDELCTKTNRKNPAWRPKMQTATIDYCYVRPHHIPAMNSLCSQFFWPGIDLTECLQYPDFSCVVLYKKLLVGFAILVPDVGCNEAYISFFLTRPEWRKSGIGTFMLYHLIQTCMGKDVTLHVSATNPALILYQKFGFKIEEFVQDFYDKYMPPGPRECRHALLLRLAR